MFNDDTGIEFIDAETIIKMSCDRHRVISYGILELDDTFNIISILHLYFDQYIYYK